VPGPLSILIIEDEPLIAMMLEDFLESLGHRVAGTVDCISDALASIDSGSFDVAILDVQLKSGELAWPIADRLREKGVPFVLATGGHVEPPPAEYVSAPLLAKPYTIDAIGPALDAACGASA
jgi:CheY-like chemotaxis protein